MFGSSKISVTAAALSLGLVFAVCLGLLAIVSMFGIAIPLVLVLSSLFVGIQSTVGGVFVALVWGFLVGGIVGYSFARLYNLIAR